MPRSRFRVGACFCALAFAVAPLFAQYSQPPETYSLMEINSLFIEGMTMQIYRDGSKAVVEETIPPQEASPDESRTRTLYDLQRHQSWTLDLTDASRPCSVGTFGGNWGDPFALSAQMTARLNNQNPRQLGAETVNGIKTKVLEVKVPQGQGEARLWIDKKYGLIVKYEVTAPDGKKTIPLEVKQFSTAQPSAELFALPEACGEAETAAEAKAPATAPQNQPPPAKSAASGSGKVTAITLTANPVRYTGACPGRITLSGTVTTDGPAQVLYLFHSSMKHANGQYKQWPGGVLNFTAPGTKSTTKVITFVGDGPHISAWLDLSTISPSEAHSKEVLFTVDCTEK